MNTRLLTLSARLCLAATVAFAATCSDDDDDDDSETSIIGTWLATSFVATDIGDLIDQGMELEITLTSSSTYEIAVIGDLADICDPGPNCTQSGTYSATLTTVTIDPGPDAVTFNWVRDGDTMTWTGTIGGTPVTITFEKQ